MNMGAHGCAHLNQYKITIGLSAFEIIHAYFVACVAKNARKSKYTACYCYTCKSKNQRLHACMYCPFFGCYTERHIHEHAQNEGHLLAVDIIFGHIYCFRCGDYIYDEDLEMMSREQYAKATETLGINAFQFWRPTNKELELLSKCPQRRTVTESSHIGLRGLVNLGNTCFMNCIVQVLIHTPLLRDFFLNDSHVCMLSDEHSNCFVCEMSDLYQEFYSGKGIPHIPSNMLYLLWTHSKHLAGYDQQDAHECFIATLDILHRHCKFNTSDHSSKCNCIICKAFTGGFQSDRICQKCGDVSTKTEPFMDISLDFGPSSFTEGNLKKDTDDAEPTSLKDCLVRFTRPERLSFKCGRCESYQESIKQFTMKQLPIVASFHLKRNEFSGTKTNLSKKISTFISFPEYLDMTQFTSSYRSIIFPDKANGDTHHNEDVNSDNNNNYYLFAVVTHAGDANLGHYVSYIRQHRSLWFRCSDETITRASPQEVLESEGYLLFYHKQILEYGSTSSS